MPRFSYSAIDSSGRERAGKIDATSESEARSKLSGQGLMVSSIGAEVSSGRKKGRHQQVSSGNVKAAKHINQEHLTIFTRQMATLLQSRLPLLRSLEIMVRQERNPGFKAVIENISENVRSGNNLSEGLQMHPKIFEPIYINMVRAGEAGGVLDTVLSRLALFMEKDLRTKKKIQSAMIYPVVVISVALIIVLGLMIFVVPAFEGIFADMLDGAPLPGPTQVLISIANFLTPDSLQAAAVSLGVLFVLIVGIVLFFKSKAGKTMVDWIAIRSPKIGDLGTKAAVSRFTRTFGTLLASGVPILQAIQITRDVIGNQFITRALDRVHDRVRLSDDGHEHGRGWRRDRPTVGDAQPDCRQLRRRPR
jgi:type IV pilus assembly protein PilC